jgi:DNA-binding NtrC family response regulator
MDSMTPPERTTLLLVEDNDMLRQLLSRALRRDTQRVLIAGNAAAALDIYENFGRAIALVISDVRLPSMGGVELAREIRRRDPQQPILLISGDFSEPTGFDELEKPFTIDALTQKVEATIAGAASLV